MRRQDGDQDRRPAEPVVARAVPRPCGTPDCGLSAEQLAETNPESPLQLRDPARPPLRGAIIGIGGADEEIAFEHHEYFQILVRCYVKRRPRSSVSSDSVSATESDEILPQPAEPCQPDLHRRRL